MPRGSTGYQKNMFKVTTWPPTGPRTTRCVFGAELDGICLWDLDELPKSDALIEFLRKTGISVAFYGSDVPAELKNPDAQAFGLMKTAASVPITFIFRTLWFFESRTGTVYAQDQTVFRPGKTQIRRRE